MLLIERFREIENKAKEAAEKAGYIAPTLVAVSKHQSLEDMLTLSEYLNSCGRIAIFGESYIQEYQEKKKLLPEHRSHMIGRLQRNKAQAAVELFDVIESVHSLSLAEALQSAAEKLAKKIEIFLQVNISNDQGKAGFLPNEVNVAIREVASLPNLELKGLMTITKYYPRPEDVRQDFVNMRLLSNEVRKSVSSEPWHISMGMSADYVIAAAEGATIIRVGSALFGERVY